MLLFLLSRPRMAEDYKTLKPGIEHNVPGVCDIR